MNDRIEVYTSSGNIFEDLGFDDPEYELNRADLAIDLVDRIRRLGMSDVEAAGALGVERHEVEDILGGRLSDVSVESLMSYLALLGQHIEIVVHPAGSSAGAGRVSVSRVASGQSAVRPPST